MVTPSGIPIIVAAIIARNIDPGILSVYNTIKIIRPIIATNGAPEPRLPKATGVPPPTTRIPAPESPITLIKSPIPSEVAFLICSGMASMIFSRIPHNEIAMKINPSMNTAASAVCHVNPSAPHT